MTFPPCVLKGGSGRWGCAGTSQQPPRRAWGAVSPPRLGKSLCCPQQSPAGRRCTDRTSVLTRTELLLRFQKPQTDPTNKKSPHPNKWATTTNPLWEKSISIFAMDFHGALLDCWSQSWQWQRYYSSPSLQTICLPPWFSSSMLSVLPELVLPNLSKASPK